MYGDKEDIGEQREGELEGMLWTVFECWHHQGELGYLPELWKEREAYSTGITKES